MFKDTNGSVLMNHIVRAVAAATALALLPAATARAQLGVPVPDAGAYVTNAGVVLAPQLPGMGPVLLELTGTAGPALSDAEHTAGPALDESLARLLHGESGGILPTDTISHLLRTARIPPRRAARPIDVPATAI